MIRRPHLGQRVALHYRAALRGIAIHHGAVGRVVAVARGPGPRNCAVVLADGTLTFVPGGNLRAVAPGELAAAGQSQSRQLDLFGGPSS